MIDQELKEKEYHAHVGDDEQVDADTRQYRHVFPLGRHLILLFQGVSFSQTNHEESEYPTCEEDHDGQRDRECYHKLRQSIRDRREHVWLSVVRRTYRYNELRKRRV